MQGKQEALLTHRFSTFFNTNKNSLMVCDELPTPSLLLFPQHLPCRCNWSGNWRRQAGREVLGQVKDQLALGKVTTAFKGKGSNPAARDRDYKKTASLCTILSRDVNQGLLSRQCLTERVSWSWDPLQQALLSNQFHSVPNTNTLFSKHQQEKRKQAVPPKWVMPEPPLSPKSNQDTWGKSINSPIFFPANSGKIKSFVSTQMWSRIIIKSWLFCLNKTIFPGSF